MMLGHTKEEAQACTMDVRGRPRTLDFEVGRVGMWQISGKSLSSRLLLLIDDEAPPTVILTPKRRVSLVYRQ